MSVPVSIPSWPKTVLRPPWLVVSAAIAYVFLIWGYLAWKHKIGFDANALLAGLLQSMTILIFVSRDILFLQWCRLTRMRAPILKGVLYLALYYTAAAVLSSAVKEASHYTRGRTILALLTPLTSFDIVPGNIAMLPEVVTGLVIQLGAIVFLLTATARKLNRAVATQPKSSPAAA